MNLLKKKREQNKFLISEDIRQNGKLHLENDKKRNSYVIKCANEAHKGNFNSLNIKRDFETDLVDITNSPIRQSLKIPQIINIETFGKEIKTNLTCDSKYKNSKDHLEIDLVTNNINLINSIAETNNTTEKVIETQQIIPCENVDCYDKNLINKGVKEVIIHKEDLKKFLDKAKISSSEKKKIKDKLRLSRLNNNKNSLLKVMKDFYSLKHSINHDTFSDLSLEQQIICINDNIINEGRRLEVFKEPITGILSQILNDIKEDCILIYSIPSKNIVHSIKVFSRCITKYRSIVTKIYKNLLCTAIQLKVVHFK